VEPVDYFAETQGLKVRLDFLVIKLFLEQIFYAQILVGDNPSSVTQVGTRHISHILDQA
jgi:hypothetical protein